MNRQTLPPTSDAVLLASRPCGVLRHKCACGRHAVAGPKCSACRQERPRTFQHATVAAIPASFADFSQVRVHGNRTVFRTGSDRALPWIRLSAAEGADIPSRGGQGGSPSGGGLPVPVPAPTPTPDQPAPPRVCGPDIKSQVLDALQRAKTAFGTWSDDDAKEACEALATIKDKVGEQAWDIVELHQKDWIIDYRPDCAWNRDECGSSANIDGKCHYMGAINYALFGVQCQLCHDFFKKAGSWVKALRFTQPGMQLFIRGYKSTSQKTLFPKDLTAFQDWAAWGYRGAPTAQTPDPSRPVCATTCTKNYIGGPFGVYWYPRSSYDNPI